MLSLAASQRTVQQPPARGAAYYLRACSRALGALLEPAALLAVLPYAGGHALGCQRLLDSLGPGRGSEGRLKAASCCSTDASSRCRCARRPRCVGCQAAESNEADPGSAKNGCDAKCPAGQQSGQRNREQALRDIEHRTRRVADAGVISHGSCETRRTGGRHAE